MKRGTGFPLYFLATYSAFNTVVISNVTGPVPHTEIVVTINIILCYFSEIVFIRPEKIMDKKIVRQSVIAAYIASLAASLYFFSPIADLYATFWHTYAAAVSHSLAATTILCLMFWYVASQQQSRKSYLFHQEVKRINRGLKPKEKTHISSN